MENQMEYVGWGLMAWVFVVVLFGLGMTIIVSMLYRIVVSTNDVHIVQSGKSTTSYGKDQTAGNTYYRWPAWIPLIGVKVIILSVSVFDVNLKDYAAYDKGRVPFLIDVMAFFRIADSNVAAQRVHSFEELRRQLEGILQGAIRSILASNEIQDILEGRKTFGDLFTQAVDGQIKAWGVVSVKSIELMDIRDAKDSQVITNIMAKKKSHIEMESRTTVAENQRIAKEAEIVAQRQVGIAQQQADQAIGERTASKEQVIGIAQQVAKQKIKEQEKETTIKSFEVTEVERVRSAEIELKANVIQADQARQRLVIESEAAKRQMIIGAEAKKQNLIIEAEAKKSNAVTVAEGIKQQTVLVAEGNLEQALKNAKGIEAEGLAKGEAEKALQLASVIPQITLAEKIGTIPQYQTYLVQIREIEKNEVVGKEQAKALVNAEIKIIVNSGDVIGGVNNVMGLLTPKGGTQLGATLEALKQTPVGEAIAKKLGV